VGQVGVRAQPLRLTLALALPGSGRSMGASWCARRRSEDYADDRFAGREEHEEQGEPSPKAPRWRGGEVILGISPGGRTRKAQRTPSEDLPRLGVAARGASPSRG